MRGKFQQLLPTREGEALQSQGKLNRKRESTKRVLNQARHSSPRSWWGQRSTPGSGS